MNGTSYHVRFWEIRANKSATSPGKAISYTVRWTVAGRERSKTYAKSAQAKNWLSDLRQAAKDGSRSISRRAFRYRC
ncbi:hypothetical protein HNP84_009634 [Thermocatellispora tengchongensis]|uniref:Uncharacterized protein n=1 Tax=Thermocatellispora tengchongensis TaxID=1073253 RepID=A0A840PQ50_9ACTN|nr:hypothetical protein [Thermocatellispora tengchongensis]